LSQIYVITSIVATLVLAVKNFPSFYHYTSNWFYWFSLLAKNFLMLYILNQN